MRKYRWYIIVLILVLIGGYFAFGRGNGSEEETLTITPKDFVKEVSVSGKVTAVNDVDLSFTEAGRVASLTVKVGDKVFAGQTLASLDSSTLQSELRVAEASLARKRAENKNLAVNLDEIEKEQETLVNNAYRKLLSDSLTAVPSASDSSVTPPIITGLYTGLEGRYKFRVKQESSGNVDNYELLTFELERTGPLEILDNEPTALGTHGLFVSFSDDLPDYNETSWYVTIPNTKSSSYLANYQAYEEAKRTRDREIASASAELKETDLESTVAEADIRSAEAEVARVKADIAERLIRAPFTGIITSLDLEIGEIASANTPAISMISADTLRIESFIPEIHVPFVKLGDPAVITLDAYGEEVHFSAKVVSLDPAETIRDGVSTYRAILEFTTPDERVKSGMTANVTITAEKKTGIISIPQNLVITRDGQKFVLVKEGEERIERVVTVGNISSFGEIEILSGLSAGDIVYAR